MDKIDFKKKLSALYSAPTGNFAAIDVPVMQFLEIDGMGDPNRDPTYKRAIEWLYSMSYAIKFAAKSNLQKDYVVPPLEGLWWADNPDDFVARRKDLWRWTMMIMVPDFVERSIHEPALAKSRDKLGEPPQSLRFEPLEEGLCLQTLHIGSYDDEGPTLARLHNEIMPAKRRQLRRATSRDLPERCTQDATGKAQDDPAATGQERRLGRAPRMMTRRPASTAHE